MTVLDLKKQAQGLLVAKGFDLGTTGPARNGVDGEDGLLTWQAIVAVLSGSTPVSAAAAVKPPEAAPVDAITPRIALELVSHEAIVLEAYLDGGGVWTWGVGVTDNSGHSVGRYKDNPQTIEHVLAVYIWLLRKNYLPDVLKAFAGRPLTEAQLAAALSFYYNTGAILTSGWVKAWLAGDVAGARRFLETHYLNGGVLAERRKKEAALFFDGKWSQDGKVTVYPVSKPSYSPKWSGAQRVDISAAIAAALAE